MMKKFQTHEGRGTEQYVNGHFHISMPESMANRLIGSQNIHQIPPFPVYPSIYLNNNPPPEKADSPMGVGKMSSNEPQSSASDHSSLNTYSRYKRKFEQSLLKKCFFVCFKFVV